MDLTLTDKQKFALYKLRKGILEDKLLEQSLGGYAGTGKTTLIKYLAHFFPDFSIAAYTGKAANILRKKSLTAQTIHSLIYQPVYEHGILIGFEMVPKSEIGAKGFIIDEASMVSKEIYHDLKFYNYPLIFVGDHGQLEPIPADFNLMKNPMYKLEEIHRYAGDIAKFCERLRLGYQSTSYPSCDTVRMKSRKRVTADDYLGVDQVICAYNKTRVQVNNIVREAMGYKGVLCEGERIMCLKNNKNMGLFNGMQGIVRKVYQDDRSGKHLMDFEFDGFMYKAVWYDRTQFGKERPDFEITSKDYPQPFDYAYCITGHKSQGDEWESVGVIEQVCDKWDHKRWAYTAGSRSKEQLNWWY